MVAVVVVVVVRRTAVVDGGRTATVVSVGRGSGVAEGRMRSSGTVVDGRVVVVRAGTVMSPVRPTSPGAVVVVVDVAVIVGGCGTARPSVTT